MTPPTATRQIGPSAAIRTPDRIEDRIGPALLRLPLDPVLTLADRPLGVLDRDARRGHAQPDPAPAELLRRPAALLPGRRRGLHARALALELRPSAPAQV